MPADTIALDSNAVRALIQGDVEVRAALGSREPCLPCVVLSEAVNGWQDLIARYNRQQQEERLAMALARLSEFHELAREMAILCYPLRAQQEYASLRSGRGNRSRNDLRIAAICIAYAVPLLTRNVVDFEDLPGLTVHTW